MDHIVKACAALVPGLYPSAPIESRTSAEIARDRLLWCQHHDPVTRPSQKRQIAEFGAAGYHPMKRGARLPLKPVMRLGKPVLTTGARVWAYVA